MSFFEKIMERIHYRLEENKLTKPKVVINKFIFDGNHFTVSYTVNGNYLLKKTFLKEFAFYFFDCLSAYDKQRIIKVQIIYDIYQNFFSLEEEPHSKKEFTCWIIKVLENDKLF